VALKRIHEPVAASLTLWLRLLSLLVGCLAGVATGFYFNITLPHAADIEIQGGRLVQLQRSIAVLNDGGPPLLQLVEPPGTLLPKFAPSKTRWRGQAYAAGVGDDLGMYLYVPLLGHYLGILDPRAVLRDMYIGMAVLLMLLYPLLFLEVSGSPLVAVAAPAWLLYVLHSSVALVDVYWVPALLLLLGAPLLLMLRDRAPIGTIVGLAVVCLLASISDSVRADTGVGLLIAAVVACFRWVRGWKPRAVTLTIMGLAFLSVYPLALDGAEAYRTSQAGPVFSSGSSHAFWHPAYLGLGYIQPNRFGIEFSDLIAYATAISYDPHVRYLSPQYNASLEHAYASIVAHDPGYALADYAQKAGDIVGSALRLFWPALALLGVSLLFWRGSSQWREGLLVFSPIALVIAIPPIFAIPLPQYEEPWWSIAGLFVALGALGPVGTVEKALYAMLRSDATRARPRLSADVVLKWVRRGAWVTHRWPLRAMFLGVAVVGGLFLGRESTIWDARTAWAEAATPTELSSELQLGPRVAAWHFGRFSRNGWTIYPGTKVSGSPEGLMVITNSTKYGYQLVSPRVTLGRGKYAVVIKGSIRAGGLSVGVLDLSDGEWLGGATGDFWYGQVQGGGFVMPVQVTAEREVSVQVVLANFSPSGGASTWDVSSIRVAHAVP
jgi:hypothetical protein